MAQVDKLRNGLIEKLMSISNVDYLKALNELVSNSKVGQEKIQLTAEQRLMLEMSDRDILEGNLVSQSDLDEEDLKWLKGM